MHVKLTKYTINSKVYGYIKHYVVCIWTFI